MSMKRTQSFRKTYRPKFRSRYSKAWEAKRAERKERRAGLAPQARDDLGFIITSERDGTKGRKPDSRRAHEMAFLAKLEADEARAESRRVKNAKRAARRDEKESAA